MLNIDAGFEGFGDLGPRSRRAMGIGVRDILNYFQHIHKTKVVRRGGGAGRARPHRWTWRTGEAIDSFKIRWAKYDMGGAYWSPLKRLKMLEEGGTITPRSGRYLAIPLPAARSGVGGAVWPRHRSDLYFARSKGGNPMLFQEGTDQPMFVLRTRVKIPPRPTLARVERMTRSERLRIMERALQRGLDEGSGRAQ